MSAYNTFIFTCEQFISICKINCQHATCSTQLKSNFNIIFQHVAKITCTCTYTLHINIIMFHVDMIYSELKIITLHVDIIYLECVAGGKRFRRKEKIPPPPRKRGEKSFLPCSHVLTGSLRHEQLCIYEIYMLLIRRDGQSC